VLFREILAVYFENHTELVNALCGQNSELLVLKAGGRPTCNYYRALKAKGDEPSGSCATELVSHQTSLHGI
jgi:hypothetical protein